MTPEQIQNALEKILLTVEKPGRYVGGEYNAYKSFKVRAGYKFQKHREVFDGIRFGFGFRKKKIDVDYAFQRLQAFGTMHRIGMRMGF